MRRRVAESLRFDREPGVTQCRASSPFKLNEIFRETLVGADAHLPHQVYEIAIGKEQLRGEDLSADFDRLVQIRLIAIRDRERSVLVRGPW
jgi:hypothetical protein